MKKVDFDIGGESKISFDKERYEKAVEDLKKYKELFEQKQGIITGYWIGWKSGNPYIMVAVEKDKSKEPEKLIPDKLAEYDVYYIEGHFHV